MSESISPADKLACIEREIGYRKRFYGDMVKSGRMLQRFADREIAVMEAIAEDYRLECSL